MKKVISLIASASLAVLFGLEDVALADDRCIELHAVAIMNEVVRIQQFLDEGVDVNCRDRLDGNGTVMMKAVYNGSVEAIVLLISRGADPSLQNDTGETARQIAQALHDDVAGWGPSFAGLKERLEAIIEILRNNGG